MSCVAYDISLGRGVKKWSIFFCRGPVSKYFRFCGLCLGKQLSSALVE